MIAGRGAVFEKAVRKVRYFSADEQTRFLIESYEKARRDELMRMSESEFRAHCDAAALL